MVARAGVDRGESLAQGHRIAKAEFCQFVGIGISLPPVLVGLAPVSLGIGEDVFEMTRDGLPMVVQFHQQCFVVGKPHRQGDALLVVGVFRQHVGLGVVEVLQAMLQLAQETISR